MNAPEKREGEGEGEREREHERYFIIFFSLPSISIKKLCLFLSLARRFLLSISTFDCSRSAFFSL